MQDKHFQMSHDVKQHIYLTSKHLKVNNKFSDNQNILKWKLRKSNTDLTENVRILMIVIFFQIIEVVLLHCQELL